MRVKFEFAAAVFAALGFGASAAQADAISDNLNVIRMSPPLAYYTPGTIARGYLDMARLTDSLPLSIG